MLGVGFLALAAGIGAVAVVLAARSVPGPRRREGARRATRGSGIARLAASSGAPVPAVTGVRFALEPGRGRTAVPVRSALFGNTLARIPLGVALGRWLWILFAHQIYAVPRATVPALSLVYVGLGALVLANVVAAVPGRVASRTSAALVVRAE